MSTPFHYQADFVLDRSHYEECFDESVPPKSGLKPYAKTLAFLFVGFALIPMPLPYGIGYLFVALGLVEGLSVRFQRTWWLWRQLLSKAANNSATFEMDDEGIKIHSNFVNHQFTWQQIDAIEATSKGYLLKMGKGRTYISGRVLDDAAKAFMEHKATTK